MFDSSHPYFRKKIAANSTKQRSKQKIRLILPWRSKASIHKYAVCHYARMLCVDLRHLYLHGVDCGHYALTFLLQP